MLPERVVEVTRINEVKISCITLAFLEFCPHLVFDLLELLRGLRHLPGERPMEGFTVDLGQEPGVAGKLPLQEA